MAFIFSILLRHFRLKSASNVQTKGSTPLMPRSATGNVPEPATYTFHSHNRLPNVHLNVIPHLPLSLESRHFPICNSVCIVFYLFGTLFQYTDNTGGFFIAISERRSCHGIYRHMQAVSRDKTAVLWSAKQGTLHYVTCI